MYGLRRNPATSPSDGAWSVGSAAVMIVEGNRLASKEAAAEMSSGAELSAVGAFRRSGERSARDFDGSAEKPAHALSVRARVRRRSSFIVRR